MAENSMINLKVFLRDDSISEARRFTVDASVVTSFIFMKEKLQTVFPVLRDADFRITWKDIDGDEITIASDEDFITAFTEMSGTVKILYVTIVQRNAEPTFFVEAETQETPYRGPRVICDVCNQFITGFRYKCLQCPDYDLCAGCEHQGHHSDHLMMRVPNNDVYMPKCTRKFMHHVARNLKKSAYHASKEAFRAAKFASKFATAGKSTEENKNENSNSGSEPSGSNQNEEESRGCPFSTAAAGAINMNDVHALGAMARQHFGPLLDVLQNQTPSASGSTEQGGLFMDIIRSAVDGFFGRDPENTSTDPQQKEAQAQPTRQETEKETQSSQNNNNGQTNPETPTATPMDTEVPPPQGPNATLTPNTNSSPLQTDINGQRRDPGWTFVATNQSRPTVNPASENTPSPPTAPTFVYHENPRIAEGLVQLHEMGFSNESGFLTHLLERFEGNVAAVVKAIVEMKI